MQRVKILSLISLSVAGILALALLIGKKGAGADSSPSTNIHSTDRFAWNDITGWIDFHETHTVMVQGLYLNGYASSPMGDISLNCATTRNGNICADSNYGVCNGPGPHLVSGTCPSGDAGGHLTGYAWNETVGWISFNCDQSSHDGANTCGQTNYGVTIDANGDFNGYAWSDLAGWISFNCANNGSCGSSSYKVNTSWRAGPVIGALESAAVDTAAEKGATLQSIIWQGTQPVGTSVDFQIAVSGCANGASNPPACTVGTWIFAGPNNNPALYYGSACPVAGSATPGVGPNTPICVDKNLTAGFRYLRYKVRLQSNTAQSQTPQVDDVILNWVR